MSLEERINLLCEKTGDLAEVEPSQTHDCLLGKHAEVALAMQFVFPGLELPKFSIEKYNLYCKTSGEVYYNAITQSLLRLAHYAHKYRRAIGTINPTSVTPKTGHTVYPVLFQ